MSACAAGPQASRRRSAATGAAMALYVLLINSLRRIFGTLAPKGEIPDSRRSGFRASGRPVLACALMETRVFHVHADWDPEVDVWVATSEDVPGLATEAPTIEALAEKLRNLIPELLEANQLLAI
ncbi:MAG TPA: DUF1902 domain-containing protein [Thermoanaerobaculia bacterium]|nr:DUF1902 domain-containing protein [Thermoanaerobaculia bacterium]